MLSPPLTSPTLRIGIYRTSSIGDVVLATACVDFLAQLPNPSEITWIGRQPTLGVIKAVFPSVRCIEIPKNASMRALKDIATGISDLHFLVDLQSNVRSKMFGKTLAFAAGIKTFSSKKEMLSRNRLVVESWLRGRKSALPPKKLIPKFTQIELMLEPLKNALQDHLPESDWKHISHKTGRPNFSPGMIESDKPWLKELRFGSWLAVSPGARYDTKRAPLEKFVSILSKVRSTATTHSLEVPNLLFVGDETDREVSIKLLNELQWPTKHLNLAGKLSLIESAAALHCAFLTLTNDSSITHLSEAIGTPTATFFGPTVESFGFSPWRKDSKAYSTLLGCRPCSRHGQSPCRFGDKLCFMQIDEEPVVDHVLSLLRNHQSQPQKGLK